jgi:hypothetical protein
MNMNIIINRNSKIISNFESTTAIDKAIKNLKRDMDKVFDETKKDGSGIILINNNSIPVEQYEIIINAKNNTSALPTVEIHASDELGFIYGIYEISRRFLGIKPFWFWMDEDIVKLEEVIIGSDFTYKSEPFAIRYRGWFINDEVLLSAWSVDRDNDKPWELAFEALLRCGGNMVIPGTDRNAHYYRSLALSMGLYITHHHAEPLGAEMFARAYPDLTPSYSEYPEKFKKLWQDAIDQQKGKKVIWNLGFRGQGDRPFWADDERYVTDKARGGLLSSLVKIQYDMVKNADQNAVCCFNLYGEVMELYQKGLFTLPNDVIKIWADNGYGKMVSRRQNNHNPRVPSLPAKGNKDKNGIYYHVSFYDLQAANHITMLPNSAEFVADELAKVIEHGGKDFWIINSSNIKPHVYFLDLIAKMWKTEIVDVQNHREEYIKQYYGNKNTDQISACIKSFADHAPKYGPNEDDHAGEQFANHVARMLVSQYMRDKANRCEDLIWAADYSTLKEQSQWYLDICTTTVKGYEEHLRLCQETSLNLSDNPKILFDDTILLQANILYHCYLGAKLTAESIILAIDNNYQKSFYFAGKARKEYLKANTAMKEREHGKWHDFYKNECLTDVKQSAWLLETLMGYVRNIDDGPHFYKWQRDFLYSEKDKRIMLILNMENHLKDLEIFELMEEKWG